MDHLIRNLFILFTTMLTVQFFVLNVFANEEEIAKTPLHSIILGWFLGSITISNDLNFQSPEITSSIGPDIDSHQGWTQDESFYYTIDTSTIYKRNKDETWSINYSNSSPFTNLPSDVNHLGDGTVYNGKLYVAATNWIGCTKVNNIQRIVLYNTNDLRYDSDFDISGNAHDVAGLGIDATAGTNGTIYTISYCDGTKIWKYDLSNGSHLGNITLSPALPQNPGNQGITIYGGKFYISNASDLTGDPTKSGIYEVDSHGTSRLVHPDFNGTEEGIEGTSTGIGILIDGGISEKVHFFHQTSKLQLYNMCSNLDRIGLSWLCPILL